PDPDTLLASAAGHAGAGTLDDAAAAFEQLQAAQPHDGGLRLIRAALEIRRERPDDAVRIATDGVVAAPRTRLDAAPAEPAPWAGALTRLGDRLLIGLDVERAAIAYHAALALASDDASAQAGLARVAQRAGRPDEALARAWQLVETRADDAEA